MWEAQKMPHWASKRKHDARQRVRKGAYARLNIGGISNDEPAWPCDICVGSKAFKTEAALIAHRKSNKHKEQVANDFMKRMATPQNVLQQAVPEDENDLGAQASTAGTCPRNVAYAAPLAATWLTRASCVAASARGKGGAAQGATAGTCPHREIDPQEANRKDLKDVI
jgi:hypothetical protein